MNKSHYEEMREEEEERLSSLFGALTKKVEFDEKDGEAILRFTFKNGHVLEVRSVDYLKVVHVKEELFCWSGLPISISIEGEDVDE